MRYVLNSAVITSPGTYRYKLVSVSEASLWLASGEFLSAVGYEETAKALSELTGASVPVNRVVLVMQPRDQALVFRLVLPAGERLNPDRKGHMGLDFIREHCEIGLLTREE